VKFQKLITTQVGIRLDHDDDTALIYCCAVCYVFAGVLLRCSCTGCSILCTRTYYSLKSPTYCTMQIHRCKRVYEARVCNSSFVFGFVNLRLYCQLDESVAL